MAHKELLESWKKNQAGTINIDWQTVEKNVGFQLHQNFKDFYSRVMVGKGRVKALNGSMKFNAENFVKEYISSQEGWLLNANGGREFCEFTLYLLRENSDKYVSQFVKNIFSTEGTGLKEFGPRADIGEILLNIGQISMIFNNETGQFEWVDYGYGYFDIYEENPYGIIADTAQEFLDKFELK